MKIKSLILGICITLCSSAFANNHHYAHSDAAKAAEAKEEVKPGYPGFCEVEVINNSYSNINVYGSFEGIIVDPFTIYAYPFDIAHTISLYYYPYCYSSIWLNVTTTMGYPVFSGYVGVGKTLYITPYLKDGLKAEVRNK